MFKIFKRVLFVLMISLSMSLTYGCGLKSKNNENPTTPAVEEKTAPVYKGLSLEDVEKQNQVRPRKNKKYSDSEMVDMISADFGEMVSAALSYFAPRQAKKYITLNFFNPEQYEILSFVLNGVKYQSYQFSEDSDSSHIKVALTMPNKSGIVNYHIDEIKYIDGTEIKDVKIDGNTEINVGISFDYAPTSIIDLVPSFDYVNFNTSIIDTLDVVNLTNGLFRMYLFDEYGIVDHHDLMPGENMFNFNNLDVNKIYDYILCATYDPYDGSGKGVHIIDENYFTTRDYIGIFNDIVGEQTISFDLEKYNEAVDFDRAELVYQDNVIETIYDELFNFDGLFTDSDYLVNVFYNTNGKGHQSSYNFHTGKYEEPYLNIEATADKNSVSYIITQTDNSKIQEIKKVELLKNNAVVQKNNGDETYTFRNLQSNTEYKVKVYYCYDMHNGTGSKNFQKEVIVRTLGLQIPTVGIEISSVVDKISGNVVLADVDNIIYIDQIALYKKSNHELINFNQNSTTFEFGVSSNVEYEIVVNYHYNLNDGNGDVQLAYTYMVTSGRKAPTMDLNLLGFTSSECNYQVIVEDEALIGSIKSIKLYNNNTFIKDLNKVDFYVDNLSSNTDYTIEVIYVYDLNDGRGVQELKKTLNFKTLKESPAISFNEVVSKDSIKVIPNILDIDAAGRISKVELYLGSTLVDLIAEGEYIFNNLSSNTSYIVKLYYQYNNNSGDDLLIVSKNITTLAKTSPVALISLTATKDTINYQIGLTDSDKTLVDYKVKLYFEDHLINEKNDLTGSFDNLLSNSDYQMIVELKYDLNDANGVVQKNFTKAIKTEALSAPLVTISASALKEEINYEVKVNDYENIFVLDSVKLLQNNEIVKEANNLQSSFTNVLSNNTYDVVLYYHYNLNDGLGNIFETKKATVTTLAKTAPSVSLSLSSTKNSIDYDLLIMDEDNILVIDNVKLMQEDVVLSNQPIENSFRNLLSNNQYQVLVNYHYDLNDGSGIVTLTTQNAISTLSLAEPVLSIALVSTKREINYEISKEDLDGVITNILVQAIRNDVVEKSNNSEIGTLDNLFSDTIYTVVLSYTYDLNDGFGPVEKKISQMIVTKAYLTPTLSLEAIATKNNISYNTSIIDPDNLITINCVTLYHSEDSIKTLTTSSGLFDNLLSNTKYQVVVNYSYNLNNGSGDQVLNVFKVLSTKEMVKPLASLVLDVTKNSISYSTSLVDSDQLFILDRVELLLNGELIASKYALNDVFDNVLADKEYTVLLKYHYDLNNGNGEISEEKTYIVNTLAYAAPDVTLTVVSNENKIEIEEPFIVDEPIVGEIYKLYIDQKMVGQQLYLSGTIKNNILASTEDIKDSIDVVVESVEGGFRLSFIDEFGIKKYIDIYEYLPGKVGTRITTDPIAVYKWDSSLKVFVTNVLDNQLYHLGAYNMRTVAVACPTYYITGENADKIDVSQFPVRLLKVPHKEIKIDYEVKVNDEDKLLNNIRIELLKDNNVIYTSNALIGSFTNLLNNSRYIVKLSYDYNLQDGSDTVFNSDTRVIETASLIIPTIDMILDKTSNSITYQLSINDPSNILVFDNVLIYKNGVLVNQMRFLNGTFAGLLSNNNYSLKVNYHYNLHDGTGIKKDVIEKSINTDSLSSPSFDLSLSSDKNTINYQLQIQDTNNVIIGIKNDLLLNGVVVQSSSDTSGLFENLLSNNEYSLLSIIYYDLQDGEGTKELSALKLIKTKEKAAPTLVIDATSNRTNINYGLLLNDKDNLFVLDKIELLNKGLKVTERTEQNGIFTDLLSNNEYVLKVYYHYDLNDGSGIIEASKEINVTTLANRIPNVNLVLSSDKFNITYDAIVTDNDNVLILDGIKLFLNNREVQTSMTLNGTFINLLSNNQYVVKVLYHYNLNDGLGDIYQEIEKGITTNSLTAPEININASSTKSTISYVANVTDVDEIYHFVKTELLLNNYVELSNDLENSTFNGLFSNTTYILRVRYIYNLNDGNGDVSSFKDIEIKTKAKVKPNVGISISELSDRLVKGSLNIQDEEGIFNLQNISLYQNNNFIESKTGSRDFSFDVRANVLYQIVVNYSYDLSDGMGVKYDSFTLDVTTAKVMPTMNTEITNVSQNEALIDIIVSDYSLTGAIKSIKLYEEGRFIRDVSLVDYHLTNLKSNTNYQVIIIYAYDLENGFGVQEIFKELEFKTLKLNPVVDFNVITTNSSINITTNILDSDSTGAIKSISLYLNNQFVKLIDGNKFSDLLSDQNYTIQLVYQYDLNDGLEEIVVTKEAHTLPLATPVLNLQTLNAKDSISYNVTYTDIDNILVIDNVSIYQSGALIISKADLNGVFDGLLSNNEYKVVVNYHYNLNNGLGIINEVLSKNIKTLAYKVPNVGLRIDNLTDTVVEGALVASDLDNILHVLDIRLYLDDSLLNTTTNDTFSFALSSNINYRILVNYSYDLHDGDGVHFDVYEYQVTSKKQTPRISFTPYLVSQNEMEYNLVISDVNVTGRLNLIALYQGGIFVSNLDVNANRLTNLSSNTNYSIKINYIYDLDDGYGSREINEEYSFKTLKAEPTYNLELVNVTKNSIELAHEIDDIDNALSFEYLKLSLNDVVVVNVVSIDELLFTGLLSNTTYKVEAGFSCNLNNGVTHIVKTISVKTEKMTRPIVDLNLTSTNNSIQYQYEILDPDNIATIKEIAIIKNGVAIDAVNNNQTFVDLLSNNEYTITLTILSDYHDGKEKVEESVSKVIRTTKLNDMELTINTNPLKDSISFGYTLIDTDNISIFKEARLLKNGIVVETINDNRRLFNNLLTNTDYQVQIIMEINYRDGNPTYEQTFTKNVKTLALADPTATVFVNPSGRSFVYSYDLIDVDNVATLKSVTLYKAGTIARSLELDQFEIAGLLSNTSYEIELTFELDYRDGNGVSSLSVRKQVTTDILSDVNVVINVNPDANEAAFSYQITDINNISTIKSIKLYLGTEYICDIDNNQTLIENLLSNKEYTLKMIMLCDYNDGNEAVEVIFTKAFNTRKLSEIDAEILVISNKKDAEFSIQLTDIDSVSTLQDIKLYKGNSLVSIFDETVNSVNNLFSNTEYRLIYTYIVDYRDGNGTTIVTFDKTFKTKALEDASILINAVGDKSSITYSNTVVDIDNILTIKEIRIYQAGILKEIHTIDDNMIFDDLFSGFNYSIVYIYEKNFNDQSPVEEFRIEKQVSTKAKIIPIVGVTFEAESSYIDISIGVSDPDNILILNQLDIYKDGVIVDTITEVERLMHYTNVDALTSYSFVLTYSYDLNDGEGVHTFQSNQNYSTLAVGVKVLSYEILNAESPKTNEDISIKLNLYNNSGITINSIIVNGNIINPAGGDLINNVIFVITSGVHSGTLNVDIQKVQYYFEGNLISQEIEEPCQFSIEVLSRLDVISVSSLNGSQFVKANYAPGSIIYIDNSYDYEIKGFYLGTNNYYDVKKIDRDHYYIEYAPQQLSQIYGIKYVDEDNNITSRYYYQSFNNRYYSLNPDDDTYALVVNKISTPEEFMNMQAGKIYELTCDLDFTGYVWEPKSFSGQFDGKGHTISNITYIVENEYESNNRSLLAICGGFFQNVYFKDIYVSIQGGGVNFSIITHTGGELNSVLFNGGVVLNDILDNQSSFVPVRNQGYTENNIYIVNQLLYNEEVYTSFETITNDEFNSPLFKKNTLGWDFKDVEYNYYNGIKYTIIDDSYIIINGYEGTNPELLIPESIDGLRVIAIDDLAFEDNTTITKLDIPYSIYYYGGSIIKGCYNLESLCLRDFYKYTSNWKYAPILTYEFGRKAFDNSYVVVINNYDIYIPNKLEELKIHGIANTSVYISNAKVKRVEIFGVGSIGDCAFYNCSRLTSIELPDSLTSIGSNAFSNCSSLTSIELPDGVKRIGNNAFCNCSGLTSVAIGSSVTSIGDYAFSGCSSLTSIELPDSLTSIGDYAFSGCSSLTSIELPDSVTSIGSDAFYNCRSLKNIKLPNSVTIIRDSAFNGCNIRNVFYNGTQEEWNNIEIGENNSNLLNANIIYDMDVSSFESVETQRYSYVLANNSYVYSFKMIDKTIESFDFEVELSGLIIKSLDDYTFSGCSSLTSIELPDSLTSIGGSAFNGCSSLTSIELPDSVTSISNSAFYKCSSLISIELPNGLTSIKDSAFSYCSSLTSIELPDSVTSIGGNAFGGCNIRNVFYNGTQEEWNNIKIGENNSNLLNANIIYDMDVSSFESVETQRYSYALVNNLYVYNFKIIDTTIESFDFEVELPGLIIKSLDDYTFSGCSSLTSIELPDSLTSISNSAFYNCSSLKIIKIPGTITSIGNRAFADSYLDFVFYTGSEEEWNNIEIGSDNSRLLNAKIEFNADISSIEYISNNKYSYIVVNDLFIYNFSISNRNENITSFNFEDELPGYTIYTLGPSSFSNCSSLTSIELPNSVTSIGNSAFSNCSSLTNIELPDNLTSIGTFAFSNCSRLTSIKLPDSVTSIGEYTFSNCSRLTSIELPDNLTSIGNSAFHNCISLASINIPRTVTYIGEGAFNNCSSLTNIKLPNSVTSIGSNAFNACNIRNVFYNGTQEEWNNIEIGANNSNLLNANIIYDMDVSSFESVETQRYSYVLVNNSYVYSFKIIDTTIESFDFEVELPGLIIKSLDNSAFNYCSNLVSINIPSTVTYIGGYAFEECSNLTSIVIPDGVKCIKSNTFYNCYNLTNISMPTSIEKIEACAFYGCSNLNQVYYSGSDSDWANIYIEEPYSNDYLINANFEYNA